MACLNKFTRLEACKNVVSDDELKALVEAKVFSVLDFRGGVYQVSLDEDSKNKTVFRLPGIGLFRFEVVPPGLLNATSTLEKLLRLVLAPCLADKFCLIYCGRIVVYSRVFEEHLAHLSRLFDAVDKQGMKLKREDCLFMQTQVRLFNSLIGSGKLVHNEETLRLVDSISRPQKRQPSKRFVRLCEVYKEALAGVGSFADLMRRMSVAGDGGIDSGGFEVLKKGILKTLDRDLGRIEGEVELILVVNLGRTCFSCSLFEKRNKREPIAFARKLMVGLVGVSSEEMVACIEWGVKSFEAVLSRRRFGLALFHRKKCESVAGLSCVVAWMETMQGFEMEFVVEAAQELNRVNEILAGMF